jgi:hypothetical protein
MRLRNFHGKSSFSFPSVPILTVSSANKRLYSNHAKELHESLLKMSSQVERVKEGPDKLGSNNWFLRKYVGDLMSTAKDHGCRAG